MKKIIIIILLLLSGGLITGYEINQIKAAQMDTRMPIVVLKETLEVGAVLDHESLEIMEIQEMFVTENAYTHIDEAIGKTLAIGLTKGTILSKNMISEQMFYTPSKGHSLTAIALKPEAIMCWEVSEGEVVDLVHVSMEGQLRQIGKVIVKGYYDQEMTQKNNFSTLPAFVLVEGESHIIEEIIRLRDNGRVEVTKSR
jgi:hypothetical protein